MKTNPLQKHKQAKQIFEDLRKLDQVTTNIYWKKAEKAYQLKQNNLYKFVNGDETQSWSSFCSENGLPKSSYDQKIINYEMFVLKLNFSEEELSQYDTHLLYYIHVHKSESPKDEVKEWMDKSRLLGRGDFIQEIKGEGEHEHIPTDTVEIRCSVCGRKLGTKKQKTTHEASEVKSNKRSS